MNVMPMDYEEELEEEGAIRLNWMLEQNGVQWRRRLGIVGGF